MVIFAQYMLGRILMRRRLMVVGAASVLIAIGLLACGDDDDAGPAKKADAGPDATLPDNYVPPQPDSSMSDTGTDAADGGPAPQVLASFNAVNGENPGGVALLPADGGGLVVSLAKNGNILSLLADGGTSPYATFNFAGINQSGGVGAVWVLGLLDDPDGSLYATISVQGPPASAGPPPVWTPAPGVWKIPPGGGTPVLFAMHPAMKTPNAMVLVGTDLFITDTGGKIFKADNTGATSIWSAAPDLVGREDGGAATCPIPIPTANGAAGIAKDANNLYVVNIDKGSLLKIPIEADGGPGAPVVIKQDCPTLGGADGLVIDKDGTFLVGVAVKNTVQRVTPAGVVTPVVTGKPLDGPAKMVIDTTGGKRRLIIGNNAFGTSLANPAAAKPSVVSVELAP